MRIVIGLDIGGTSYKLGAWAHDVRLAWTPGLPPAVSAEPEEVAAHIATLLRHFMAGLRGEVAALGIGSCGLISGGVILQSPNTPWDRLPLCTLLAQQLGLPVQLINDADAFLLSALATLERPLRSAIGLTLGTGLGTAVWLDGRLLAGGSGISPEAGHITLDVDGPAANTGIPGSWEHLACRSALLRYYQQYSGREAADPLDVAQAAQDGEAAARQAWELYGQRLGAGLGSLCNIFSPQCVLIGGGLSGARALFEAALAQSLERHKLAAMPAPEIRYCAERADSVAHGAARQAQLELAL
jgi:glucokinase